MAALPPISRAGFQIPESLTLFNSLLHSDLEDKELRLTGWEDLKQRAPIGPLNIPKMMQEIEQESLNNGKPLVDHVDALFNRLTEKLRPDFEATKLPDEELEVTELHLTALQTRLQKRYEDEALQTIWNVRLRPLFEQQGAFQHVAPPNGVEEIRAWLNDPANKERIQQVIRLDLSSLKLKALPSEIGLFTGLQQLSLSNNQLSSLPESLGNLQALTWIALPHNQLSSLPESLGNLQALTHLYLSNNQLSSLPESLGNLQALTELFLYNNQLSSLPDSFNNLTALNCVFLNHNPLMLVSDKEPHKIIDYQTYFTLLEALKKHTPQSPLATLFQAIIFNKPVEAIQQAYSQLSPEMQHRIADLVTQYPNYSGSTLGAAASSSSASSSSDPSPVQESLFADIGLFARSVRKATYDLYDSIGPEQKKLVHDHVWDLAGRPETADSNWGEHHVFDHVLRFVDALERAAFN
ncbi:MAG: leucine-rich repeat domain-containing protein [Verrucomicrobia bacterium]|nr:leucine-rich repeat domain-containing protein [Verrucomicrobiota bacterium]